MHLRWSEFAVRKSIRTDFALAISSFSAAVVFGTVDSVVCCAVSAEVTCLFSEAVCPDAFVVDWVPAFVVDAAVLLADSDEDVCFEAVDDADDCDVEVVYFEVSPVLFSFEEQEPMKNVIVAKSKINMILCSVYFFLHVDMLNTSILRFNTFIKRI